MIVKVLDIECYRDYFLVALKNVDTGVSCHFDMWPDKQLDTASLIKELLNCTLITFNGINYDMPILSLALSGCSNEQLKCASDSIIVHGEKHWNVGVDFSFKLDHIDLIEVAPGKASLKMYGGRLHSKRLQDLPIDPSASILPSDRNVLLLYCLNDLDTTIDLYCRLEPQLQLRKEMSNEFGIDLRSKSDAQIAEAVIKSEVEKITGNKTYRPQIHPDYMFSYNPPNFIQFQSPGMMKAFEIIKCSKFSIDSDGSVKMPKELESIRLRMGKGVYRMGVGGLHSSEECRRYVGKLYDRDVTGYYPQIVLNLGLYPAHIGPAFLQVYRSLVDRRLEAKRSGNKVWSDSLKICVNGSFGKFGSKWSVLYSPELMIQVTLTGQLALLMLIECLEISGIDVISANTDGIVVDCPKNSKEQFDAIVAAWEFTTGFKTEENEYSALYSKDVNNYIAIKPDGSTKLKGAYATSDLQKNCVNSIVTEAVISELTGSFSIEEIIYDCSDIKKFVTIRQVKGGAKYGEQYLGKAVRWYYAKGETRHIEYATNGHKVPKSDGARPLMMLPCTIPNDIDLDWYIKEARSVLDDVGC